ncbi:MAG TPA: ribonuclease HI family protein [Anaerolineae bacterium]|nr:ribonuclease HI family protein [Anaerolineae bacterium]
MLWRKRRSRVIVQFDGAIGSANRASGLGVVFRDETGRILEVWSKRARPQTCNEAEYEALIWALEILGRHPPAEACFLSDSEIVVNQMQGFFSVRSPALKRLHRRACALLRAIPRATFTHIPREQNCLADALAVEALHGWPEVRDVRGGEL